MTQPDPAVRLRQVLTELACRAHPELRVGCRSIAPGDEYALTPAEALRFASAITAVRRASGSARKVARELLRDAGVSGDIEIRKLPSGAPQWPVGFIGSLAHDERFSAAVIAPDHLLRGVGIDLEPRLPLPPELLNLVTIPNERVQIAGNLILARLLFCAKEAVYKVTNPIDGVFLEHGDIEICLRTKVASTVTGHRLNLHLISVPRLLAIAVLQR